ncbi:type I methionyl aminopeptidase [Calycomorphotria hydatis]|uniref:Methionine aminopeptidase n=1 Tax=Calycomorphotria hydatis TaxID=2528027 RepID=A0A517T887_9PLAN|nr:type I methionyl aminopeptidase [Calycomorphotria hydatis]QDT64590.1 Methionine aminopeptidase 1 [Calycomorphotria hydatis]
MPKTDAQQDQRRAPRKGKSSPSTIVLKSKREIEKMRAAGKLVAEAHGRVRELIRPGITTAELDAAVEKLFLEHGATPLFRGVPCPEEGGPDFPAVTCTSVNEEVVHGIPGPRVLEEGDIVSVDTGCRFNGWCGDSAWTYAVGEVDAETQRLMDVGQAVLALAIREFGRCSRWTEVAAQMQELAESNGYGVVKELVGHAIGREMHEVPQVPNFVGGDFEEEDFELRPGLVLAIEPMINGGTADVVVCDDDWTVVTEDDAPSVHFEHTVALTANGPEILTFGVGNPLKID